MFSVGIFAVLQGDDSLSSSNNSVNVQLGGDDSNSVQSCDDFNVKTVSSSKNDFYTLQDTNYGRQTPSQQVWQVFV